MRKTEGSPSEGFTFCVLRFTFHGLSRANIPQPIPPRAFMQGVGTIFQFTGVIFFLTSMFVCCGSSLLSKDVAENSRLTTICWHSYSAQRAITVGLLASIFFGMALAGIGLGLQAQNHMAPLLAVIVTGIATVFWFAHAVFFAQVMHSIVLTAVCAALGIGFILLFILAIGAYRELLRDPPPRGMEILPADYEVPYSHLHKDSPEVRLAQELDQRRQRLAVQQKELQMLEEKLRRKMEQRDPPKD
jgi:hypothetical protein